MKRSDFVNTLEEMAKAADEYADGCRALARNLGGNTNIAAQLKDADAALGAMRQNVHTLQRAVGSHPTLEAVDPAKHTR